MRARAADLDRRVTQHHEDIRAIFKELRWLRTAMVALMAYVGVEPPLLADGEE